MNAEDAKGTQRRREDEEDEEREWEEKTRIRIREEFCTQRLLRTQRRGGEKGGEKSKEGEGGKKRGGYFLRALVMAALVVSIKAWALVSLVRWDWAMMRASWSMTMMVG